MKYTPYKEIIDMKSERKEYSLLCRGKSKKYKHYSDWEEHIEDCLSNFATAKDLYNFKRYCMNFARAMEKAPDMYLGYIVLLITMCIDKTLVELPLHIMLMFGGGLICYSIIQNKRLAKESFFYKDIIEIIEKPKKTVSKDLK